MSHVKSIQLALDEALERMMLISSTHETLNTNTHAHQGVNTADNEMPVFILMEDDRPVGVYTHEGDALLDLHICRMSQESMGGDERANYTLASSKLFTEHLFRDVEL